jgi:alpha-1,2-mannosyltransferase
MDRTRGGHAVFCLCALILALIIGWTTWHLPRQTDFFDFRIYRDAIHSWVGGHDLYSFQEPHTIGGLGFTYPPFAALVLLPVAMLPLTAAEWTMTAISLAICVGAGFTFGLVMGRRFQRPPLVCGVLATAALLGLEPIRQSLGYGQINIVLLGLVLLDIWLLSGSRRGSGIAIGVAAAIKLTPAILILVLLTAGYRAAARRGVLAFVAAALFAAVVQWRESWRFWTSALWDTARVGSPSRVANQALSGVIARAQHHREPSTVLWLAGAALVTVGAMWFGRRVTAERGWWSVLRMLTVGAAASTAASPISWSHHYWWCVPALAALTYYTAATYQLSKSRAVLPGVALVAAFLAFALGPADIVRYVRPLGSWTTPLCADLFLFATVLVCAVLVFARTVNSPATDDSLGDRADSFVLATS